MQNNNNIFRTFEFVLPSDSTLTPGKLNLAVAKFWAEVVVTLDVENNHLLVLPKVQFINREQRTIAEMRRVNYEDCDLYSEYLVNRLGLLTETYRDTAIIKIFFEYAGSCF